MRSSVRAVPLVAALGVVSLVVLSLLGATPAGAVTGQYWVGKLQLTKVWKITRGAGVTVAVVDSGVPPTGDLGSRLLAGRSFVGGGSGRVDPGQSTGGGGNYSHGQNMAEIVAGDGSDGITGIAPEAKILPVKVGAATGSSVAPGPVAAGIRYAVQHGAQVVNLSLAGSGRCGSEAAAAIKYAYRHDVVVVAGAGNDGAAEVDSPADCPGALAVSGIDSKARPWSGSNYGPEIDVTNFAKDIPGVTFTGQQGATNGTSEATAFTSGEIALLRAKYPHDSARAIVTRLLYGIDNLTTTVKNGTRVNDHVGYGVPVPLDELRDTVPSSAPNPIYDQFFSELGAGSGNTAATHSSSPSSGPGSSQAAPPATGAPPSHA
ncbi:S8 family serine peptidase, partial [Jatrophihabitans endophyticus]|uniref:S8 family serine peptidase n=1 Tax=Jatrophihabitans endophyticus TaxID=1206085 RepID=UPI0019E7C29B